jgi:hypothetical protein
MKGDAMERIQGFAEMFTWWPVALALSILLAIWIFSFFADKIRKKYRSGSSIVEAGDD